MLEPITYSYFFLFLVILELWGQAAEVIGPPRPSLGPVFFSLELIVIRQ